MELKKIFIFLTTVFLLIACIQDEAPNFEADIETCTVEENILMRDPQIENTRINLIVKPTVDITKATLHFTLTPGATIDPPSGTVRDLTQNPTYTVTSEDRKSTKTYAVSCTDGGVPSNYDFEHFRIYAKYYLFYELSIPEGEEKPQTLDIWSSGNAGFSLIAGNTLPEDFPTAPSEFGKSGYCLKLETKSTGSFGERLKMPIAAGNLFFGTFKALNALMNPLKATEFGIPFNHIPIYLEGHYKYKAGEVYKDKENNVVPDKKDNFDIYAIMYETDETVKFLDGTNSLTSPNLVAIARFDEADKKETDTWTRFELPFVYLDGKEIDQEKLKNNIYNIAIIFSSSIDGALFNGAIGSTLLLDEVRLVYE